MGKFSEGQKILDGMDANTLLVLADLDGAALFAKLRGIDAFQLGRLMGGIIKTVKANEAALLERARAQEPIDGVAKYMAGKKSAERGAVNELMIRDRKPPGNKPKD
jgi:hypothetical protein